MLDRMPEGGFAPLVPELDVTDLERSLAFWCEGLGFDIAYQRPENGFAYLEHAASQVMLNRINGAWETGSLARPFGRGINLQITVRGIDPMLERLATLGWPLFRPAHEAWYRVGAREVGCRQFLIPDPDGYLLRCQESLGVRPVSPVVPGSSH